MNWKDSVYFSIAAMINLKESYELTIDLINTVVEFFKSATDQTFMLLYQDRKAFRKNKLTEKNYTKLIDKLRRKEVFAFITISKYCTNKEFYETSGEPIFEPEFECEISIDNNSFEGEFPPRCDELSLSIPLSFFDHENTNNQKKVVDLIKTLTIKMNAINVFVTRGNYDGDGSCGLFDSRYCSHTAEFSAVWDKYVRGYYWGHYLNPYQVEKLGGVEEIKKHGLYLVEKWNDGIYIQSTENINDYTVEHALVMRKLLLPLFPPDDLKRSNFKLPYKIDFLSRNENFSVLFAEEDIYTSKEYLDKDKVVFRLVSDKIKSTADKYGFTQIEESFYRITNGVVVGFKIHTENRSPSAKYDVKYAVYALGGGWRYSNYIFSVYDMYMLFPEKTHGTLYLIPDAHNASEAEMDQVWANREKRFVEIAEQLSEDICNVYLPYLNEIDSAKKGYNANIEAKVKMYMGIYRCSEQVANEIFSWGSPYIPMTWALQTQDWERAKEWAEAYIKMMKQDRYAKEEDSDIPIIERLYNELCSGNIEYVKQDIMVNEKGTMKSFGLKSD